MILASLNPVDNQDSVTLLAVLDGEKNPIPPLLT